MFNLSALLEHSARAFPDRDAVVLGQHRMSYAEVEGLACRIANALVAQGIGPGDKIALSCPNLPWFPVAYYGILKTGAAVVPLNVLFKSREVGYHLRDSQAKAYLCFEGTPALPMAQAGKQGFDDAPDCAWMALITANPAGPSPVPDVPSLSELIHEQPTTFDTVQRSPDDTAVILYTSGTTGQPKGAELTHANMLLNARLCDTMYEALPHEKHLIALPLFHSFGQTVQMNTGFYYGATLVLLPRFEPQAALQAMQDEGVTFFAGVPTMYWALLNAPGAEEAFDLPSIANTLHLAVSGGAAMPVAVLEAFRKRFSVEILEGYGLSETSPVATFNRLDRVVKPGTVGLPVWGVEVRVVDSEEQNVPPGERGEIIIRGHCVMKGYFNRPEATAESIKNGWLHTGDVGIFDDDGYLSIVDRVKDMIIRGGFNVYPRELEEVLLTHPKISLAAVVGVPHDAMGEEIKAFVILKPGQTASTEELIAWCRENMASYKCPRIIEIRDELPMTATGKILKRELKSGA